MNPPSAVVKAPEKTRPVFFPDAKIPLPSVICKPKSSPVRPTRHVGIVLPSQTRLRARANITIGERSRSDPVSAVGAYMKKAIMFSLLAASLLLGLAFAQTKSTVTVKGSELNNGVILVDVIKDGKAFELSCNQGTVSCASLKSGKYVLVELPPNRGMYDCKDVEVYADPGNNSEPTKKMGEYCLAEK